ncbi:hypothetical protein B0T21DRAFT_417085 [Apiosordaria backusii]|uniref:2,6-dihydroxypyridine 3-monooxygenase substrate binding domain-containing protein n=1 Tax=Apiosordaria backusii TaxID=314023 RepID=A0AA39ZQ14_9PEZI|nr:hypothetical protein B0T21DRAFT_417085 [Apiosordaria backusii]
MANFPPSAVIVGRSLAGFMHGLVLKRHETNVTILEQEPAATRSSHNAGIGFGPQVEELLREYCDVAGVEGYYAPAVKTRLAFRKRENFKEINVVRHLTSWVLLYRILRANFDGFASSTIPNPPPPQEMMEMLIHFMFIDATTGKEPSLTADLLIGADGINSIIRELVLPSKTPTCSPKNEYSGYIAWRGTVPETSVSASTRQYFSNRTCANILPRSSIITYTIPSDGVVTDDNDSSHASPRQRLINFVWCLPLPSDSPTIDVRSPNRHNQKTPPKHHPVPTGLIQPQIWNQQKTPIMLNLMAEPFAELISTCDITLVLLTKVNDTVCPNTASFHNGKVFLVGVALVA